MTTVEYSPSPLQSSSSSPLEDRPLVMWFWRIVLWWSHHYWLSPYLHRILINITLVTTIIICLPSQTYSLYPVCSFIIPLLVLASSWNHHWDERWTLNSHFHFDFPFKPLTLTFAFEARLLGFWQSFVIRWAGAIFHGKTERTACVWQIMPPFMAFSLNRHCQRGTLRWWCDDDSYDGPCKEAGGSVFVLILMWRCGLLAEHQTCEKLPVWTKLLLAGMFTAT